MALLRIVLVVDVRWTRRSDQRSSNGGAAAAVEEQTPHPLWLPKRQIERGGTSNSSLLVKGEDERFREGLSRLTI